MTAAARPPRIKRRPDFLAAARARRSACPFFILQARRRTGPAGEDAPPARVGFTASKKVGGAVARNRAKRRLRAVADLALPELGRAGWDYVLIARADATAAAPFERLLSEFRAAVAAVHAPPRNRSGPRP